MTKTYANSRSGVINENFYEVPNLATTSFTIQSNMNRSYEVNNSNNNSNNNNSDSITTISNGNLNGLTSTSHLYDNDESENKSKLSRYLGVLFLIGLVLLSIAFLTFAIFYDEIIDSDGENAEEYWSRIQKEIKLKQNLSQSDLFNKTLGKPGISFENFISRDLSYRTFYGKWISNNELLHYDSQNNLCIFDVLKMTKDIIIASNVVTMFRLSGLSLSSDRKYLLIPYNSRKVYRYSTVAKYRIYSITENQLSVAIVSPHYPQDTYLNYAEWGPIGSQILFVHKNDIYFKSNVNSLAIRVTNTGKDMLIYNGEPDWVYGEEIISGPKTMWLSPSGTKLVYATINDSSVDLMTWPYYGTESIQRGYANQYTRIETVRYPKPGRPNPTVSVNYIDLNQLQLLNNSQPITVRLTPPQDILNYGDHLMTTINWMNENVFGVNWMNRVQNFSVLTCYGIQNNMLAPISNFKLQSSNGWIDLFTPPLVTPDKNSYLLRVPKMSDNQKDVFQHIAKVSVSSAQTTFQTSGVFEVRSILNINQELNRIYFMATIAANPGAKHLMSATLDQPSVAPICHTCLMNSHNKTSDNKTCLVADVVFSQNADYYILNCLGPNIPHSEVRKTADDSLVYTLEDNNQLNQKLQNLSLPKRILMKIPMSGYEIDVMLYVPQDFDEKSNQKYPLVLNVYGGPGSDSGTVSQNYFYHQFGAYLVSNKSVIYAYLDTRGGPNHGSKFMFDIYRRMGTVEVEDTISIARYFRDNVVYIDKTSISVWGWSYGGYLTTMALENDYNSTVFKCGVAVAPVSDWMYYDSVYVERYMGFPTPEDNLKNYIKSSTLDKVNHLSDKQYLVMFGTADDNVHAMNSMMLLKAMNEANIKYQTQIYPDNRHSLQNSMLHMYRRMVDFLDNNCFNRKQLH